MVKIHCNCLSITPPTLINEVKVFGKGKSPIEPCLNGAQRVTVW